MKIITRTYGLQSASTTRTALGRALRGAFVTALVGIALAGVVAVGMAAPHAPASSVASRGSAVVSASAVVDEVWYESTAATRAGVAAAAHALFKTAAGRSPAAAELTWYESTIGHASANVQPA